MRDSMQDTRTNKTHLAIIVAAAVLLMVLSSLYAIPTLRAADNAADDGTVPPITVTVDPKSDVSPGAYITYSINLLKTPRDYPITLKITSTVPASLTVLPETLFASLDPQPTFQGDLVTWQGEFEASDEVTATVTIRYVVRAPDCNAVAARTLTGTVTMQTTQDPPPADQPAPTTLMNKVTLAGCIAFIPAVKKAAPFPTLVNGNLAQGPNVGWGQEPFPLIYAKNAIPPAVQSGAGSDFVAWLGGSSNMTNTLTQTVTIPAERQAQLKYRYYTASQEPQRGADTAIVWAVSEGEPTKLAEYALSVNEDTNAWKQDIIDLKPFSGKTIELRFQSVLNGARNSNWFLNNFELCEVGNGC